MGQFLPGVEAAASSFFESLTGQTAKKNFDAQLAAQKEMNLQVLELEKQKQAYEQTPAYQNEQYVKYGLAFLVFLSVGFVLFKLTK